MKIWKAELYLNYNIDDKWQTRFLFEEQKEDYEENPKFNEWTYFKNWVGHKIPMDIQIENSNYSGVKVMQGFDHKLTDDELAELKEKMKGRLREYLEYEKDSFLKTHSERMNAIN